MNWWIGIFAIVTAFFLPGCSVFDTKEDIAVTPTLAVTSEPTEPSVLIEKDVVKVATPTPVEVPRITQPQAIGILRELRANGCMIKKYANTDAVHYAQLVVTCGDPQAIPEVQ